MKIWVCGRGSGMSSKARRTVSCLWRSHSVVIDDRFGVDILLMVLISFTLSKNKPYLENIYPPQC